MYVNKYYCFEYYYLEVRCDGMQAVQKYPAVWVGNTIIKMERICINLRETWCSWRSTDNKCLCTCLCRVDSKRSAWYVYLEFEMLLLRSIASDSFPGGGIEDYTKAALTSQYMIRIVEYFQSHLAQLSTHFHILTVALTILFLFKFWITVIFCAPRPNPTRPTNHNVEVKKWQAQN